MGFLDTILGRKEYRSSKPYFGRYSDSQKTDDKYDHWDQSLVCYENEDYYDSFIHILEFLKDEKLNNLSYTESKGLIIFEFYQGSKLIKGEANRLRLRAEAKVAITSDLEIGFARHLIEQNFDLQYCRFCLNPDNDICIVFDTYAADASPYKLYYAFKELASKADKHDDLLVAEYDSLTKVNDQHISPISQTIKDVKYSFVKNNIERILHLINNGEVNIEKYPSGLCYLVLDLIYKIDYLVKPEGQTMDMVEEIHRTYINSKDIDIYIKNQKVLQLLKHWLLRPKSDFEDEIYNVISTFGITMPSGHDKLSECIESEISNMDWYYDNKYDVIALALPSYLVGYLMFSYALPDPDKEFLHLLYEILESDYFAQMGFPNDFWKGSKLNPSAIKKQISAIRRNHENLYPNINPDFSKLHFSDLISFSKSYLLMLTDIDMTKLDLRD